uniref:Ras-related protein Rab-26-like n=1 Tax=Stegastes partitus TaxID=144197 RepID=A0A3B4Z2Z5_9TELE
MSRKKAVKSKGSSKSPKASPSSGRTGKGLAAAAAPSSGLVYPSRPSISNSGEFYDIAFKVMLVGDSGVGKTCLLVRFKDGAFLAGSFISTVGIDFRNKVMTIDAVKVKLQIWDTAGQERFRSVTHAYYRDAHGTISLFVLVEWETLYCALDGKRAQCISADYILLLALRQPSSS